MKNRRNTSSSGPCACYKRCLPASHKIFRFCRRKRLVLCVLAFAIFSALSLWLVFEEAMQKSQSLLAAAAAAGATASANRTLPSQCKRIQEGFATLFSEEGMNHVQIKAPEDCLRLCADTEGCTCWAWNDKGLCRTAQLDAASCGLHGIVTAVGSHGRCQRRAKKVVSVKKIAGIADAAVHAGAGNMASHVVDSGAAKHDVDRSRTGSQCLGIYMGYATERFDSWIDNTKIMTPPSCRAICMISPKCNCWAWNSEHNLCRTGTTQTCTGHNVPDANRWRYGRCS